MTARIMTKIANDTVPDSIKMVEDTCSRHANGRIPILDTEMWIGEEGQVRHSHYKKPMASGEVILTRSAMSTSSKEIT